jgi:hypothetical protein
MNDGYSHLVGEKGKEEWKEIYDYWRDKTVEARMAAILPEELKGYEHFTGCGDAAWIRLGPHVGAPNFYKLFKLGMNGIIRQAEERKELIKGDFLSGKMNGSEYVDQQNFLEAAIIALKAAARYGERVGKGRAGSQKEGRTGENSRDM